jgi:uncharacterized membrane protein YccC
VLADRLQNARDLIFASDDGPGVRRETSILLHIIDLRDLAMASNLDAGLSAATPAMRRRAEVLGQIVERISDAVRSVALHLRTREAPVVDKKTDSAIQSLHLELEQAAVNDGEAATGVNINSLLRNKLELLHSLQELLKPEGDLSLPCQRSDLRRYITPDEWRLDAVMSNFRVDAPVFRHAARTCITATAAYAVSRIVPMAPHPQWVLLTIAAVMQGSLAQTLLRRNGRVLGTLLGCLVVVALTTSSSTLFLSACFLLAAGVAHAFFGVRYAVTAGAAAVMAVLQAHLTAPATGFSTLERFGDTVAGALLGWAATYAIPIWERKNLPRVLRQAVDALRGYAVEATALRDDATGLPRFSRQQAYDAIRALSAIRTRSLSEPADVRVPVPQLTAWLSAAYGVMAHLSNIRLALVLHARGQDAQALGAAMAATSRSIDELLGNDTTALHPTPLGSENELALAAVPHLASRVHRVLDDASRVSSQMTEIEALIKRPSASVST